MCMLLCRSGGKMMALVAGGVIAAAALAGTLTGRAFADDKPTQAKPAETKPAETKPVEAKPVEAKPAENKPAAEKPEGEKKEEKKAESSGLSTGDKSANFTLKDTAGNDVQLSTLVDGNTIVVLEWFNPDCPFVVKHHKNNTTFKDLFEKYKDKGVKFVAINSGAKGEQGHGLERNQRAVKDYSIGYPVLIDESGTVGKTYGAKRTPEMFIIAKDGTIAYHGAIDDNRSADTLGKVNYVSKALDEMLKGETVSTNKTPAYGCSVKYKKD
jgi:peroxiredoxin